MNIIEPGTRYELHNYGSETVTQPITFTRKDNVNGGFIDGTTNEEVISMLLDRFKTLNTKAPSIDNEIIIHQLKDVQITLAARASKIVAKKIQNSKNRESNT